MNNNKTILIKEKNDEKIANVQFADSYFSRLRGLIFKEDIDYVLVLKPAKTNKHYSSIHTFFMRMTIDVVFLDKNKRIYEIKKLKPWKIYTPKVGARYILELKEGSIERYNMEVNDKLDFVCELR